MTADYIVVRSLPPGRYPLTTLLPALATCPQLPRILGNHNSLLVTQARVRVAPSRHCCHLDTTEPCIVVDPDYYRDGDARDLYLDLLHEFTHLRQHLDGRNLWDERLPYEQRPTEIEAFAVAVAEGQRLGMTEGELLAYLQQPWLTAAATQTLYANVTAFLATPATLLRHGQRYVRIL